MSIAPHSPRKQNNGGVVKKALTTGVTLLLILISARTSVAAEDIALTATPDKCVAMRKGQTCYQRITLKWHGLRKGRFCLLIDNQPSALKCWIASGAGSFQYPFESNQSRRFTLINIGTASIESAANGSIVKPQPLAEATVTLAWVYNTKSRRRSTWRLF